MNTLSSTRHNFSVDPALHLWGWEIPTYLFLGGLVAGLMILAGYHILKDRGKEDGEAIPYAPMLGFVLLTAGMGALFLDLEHKSHVWRLYLTFEPKSPMSWGSWILLLVYPTLVAAAILRPPLHVPFGHRILERVRKWSSFLHQRAALVQAIGMAAICAGVALGLYTGILLGTLGARPLWNSAILGPLFLFSGLSSAAALMHLLSFRAVGENQPAFADALLAGLYRLLNPHRQTHFVVRADLSFLIIELGILAIWLIGLATTAAVHQDAVALLLGGPYTAVFWGGIVATGIVIPVALQYLELAGKIRATAIPAVLVLAGGFLLRAVLVSAGQVSHW